MQFLYPIGLLALAGLMIPLIIHLWNVKQGKTLKIGSIALLGESSRASSKSFKINDWLLLVLRCLLILLAAFILSQPFIKKASVKQNMGWILVEQSNFPKVFKAHRKSIDSLTRLGYEIHDFNVGFNPISLKDTANTDTTKTNSLSYASLLNQLNTVVPSGSQVYLFADKRLSHIGYNLPETTYKLNWQPLNPSDTLSSWIADYAGKKYEAQSNPSATVYRAVNNEAPPLRVAIYEASGNADKKYLIAALNAIAGFSGRQLDLNPKGKAAIGFWLADVPVSANFKSAIDTNGTLFQYEKGKVIPENTFLNIEGRKIPLTKRIEAPKSLSAIWTDGFGNTILARKNNTNLNIYQFYSRLNPQWNQLVWNEVFVKALMPMVLYNEKVQDFGFEDNPADQRRFTLNPKEIIQKNEAAPEIKTNQNESVSYIIWLIAFIIFVAERILSFRKKTINYVKN